LAIVESLLLERPMLRGDLEILEHEYLDGELRYRVKKGKTNSWVSAELLPDTAPLRAYWQQYAHDRFADQPLPPLTQMVYKVPTRILDVRRTEAKSYFLAEFDGIDAPVLIPCQTLRNLCPQMVIDFFESIAPNLS
jgi:hypothetical protein